MFEGVDRCGKTTQAKKLVESFIRNGRAAVFMRFPDRETEIGKMISGYLERSRDLDDHAVHLLFSANRWECKQSILDTLQSGRHVIMDRYAYSGVAFTSAKPGMDLGWCKSCDAGLPEPDVVLYMRLSTEAAATRGGFGMERYESSEFQAKVQQQFDILAREAAFSPGLWQDVDAAGTVEEVHERVTRLAEVSLQASASLPIRTLWNGNASEIVK